MLYYGDYVKHNTFPPIEGYVSIREEYSNGGARVAVLYNNNETLYWDDESTWDLVEQNLVIEECGIVGDVIDVEFKEV